MGRMKDLLITIYGGGDEAVAAVQRLGEDWRLQLEAAAAEEDRLRLTDAEREAVERAVETLDGWQKTGGYHSAIEDDAATLRGLLERMPTNHDAVPAATAPVDRLVRLGATDRESVGTDKAEPLNRDCGTGNTTDRPQPVKDSDFDRSKPIRDARLAALEELSALDQKLELEYGLTGNPLIKARQRTQPPQTTPGECSKPREGSGKY